MVGPNAPFSNFRRLEKHRNDREANSEDKRQPDFLEIKG
jgi:hypothetical protein